MYWPILHDWSGGEPTAMATESHVPKTDDATTGCPVTPAPVSWTIL